MIGVFDSGVGGLTAVKSINRFCKNADVIYFGDTARVPYGTRSKDVIDRYATEDCRFLIDRGVNIILAACGTVSSNSLGLLQSMFDIPIIGVVDASAKKAAETAEKGNGTVCVLGTSATVSSGAFEKAIHGYNKNIKVISRACPLLVPLAENRHFGKGDLLAEEAVKNYISDILPEKPTSLILGCTHFPLFAPLFAEYLPETVLVNSAEEAVISMLEIMKEKNIDTGKNGVRKYFVSDGEESFVTSGKLFLGGDISENTFIADISAYGKL